MRNVEGTFNVLETARERNLYTIFSSSSGVYGSVKTLPRNENLPTRPISPYAASKMSGESYFLAFQNAYSLKSLVFRFFNVFGPYQSFGHPYAAVIPRFLDAISNNLPIPLEGDGSQTKDFTSVKSVIDSIIYALTKEINYFSPINLAFGENISILDLISKLQLISGKKFSINYLPRRVGDVDKSQSDPKLFKKVFPEANPISFDLALNETFKWFKRIRNS